MLTSFPHFHWLNDGVQDPGLHLKPLQTQGELLASFILSYFFNSKKKKTLLLILHNTFACLMNFNAHIKWV